MTLEQKLDDCSLCQEGLLKLGEVSNYGAAIVYTAGIIENGWYATLQEKTPANPKTGFSVHIMPQAHLVSFDQIVENDERAKNFGVVQSLVYKAMIDIFKEQKDDLEGPRLPRIGVYGKCGTFYNTKEHIHFKVFEISAGLDQPWPSDNPWFKKELLTDGVGNYYVSAKPVNKSLLDKKRFNYLQKRLIALCNP